MPDAHDAVPVQPAPSQPVKTDPGRAFGVSVTRLPCPRVAVTVVQSPPALPEGVAPTLRDHRIAIGVYNLDGAALTRTERIELDVTGTATELCEYAPCFRGDRFRRRKQDRRIEISLDRDPH